MGAGKGGVRLKISLWRGVIEKGGLTNFSSSGEGIPDKSGVPTCVSTTHSLPN